MDLTLLWAALTAVAAIILTNRVRRDRIAVDRPTDLLVGAAAIGMLVGRLAAMIGAGVNPLTHPLDVVVVRGGVSTGWAAMGSIGVLAWTLRRRLPETLDQLAPAVIAGLAGWHAGCVWRGSCLGVASDLPWAVAADAGTPGRHPVELYAAAGYAMAAFVLGRITHRPWLASGIGLAVAGSVRLLTQPLRVSIVGGPVGWYVAAVVLGLGVAAGGHMRTRTRPPGPSSIEM